MAINKGNSPIWVKAVIWVVIVAFVLLGFGFSLTSLFSGSGGTGTGTAANNAASSVNASDTLSAISKTYSAKIEAIDAQLAADAGNRDLILGQAKTYYEWANAVLMASDSYTEARPMAALAVQSYERAFAIEPGDAEALKDYAAALFYSGDTANATSVAEGIVAKDPKYAPAYFNLGVFYADAGRLDDAIGAYQTAIDLDPQGPDADELKSRISQLQQARSAPPTPAP